MSLFIRGLLVILLGTVISCSKGGADGDSDKTASDKAAASDANNKDSNSILGQWSSGNINIELSEKSLKINVECNNKQKLSVTVAIRISSDKITILEDKVAGKDDQCSITLKKDFAVSYQLNGDKLILTLDQGPETYTRVGAATAPDKAPAKPGNTGGNGGADNGAAGGDNNEQVIFEFYSAANCQGTKSNYTMGMNCALLKGNVASLRQPGQACNDTQQVMTAASVCEAINQQ